MAVTVPNPLAEILLAEYRIRHDHASFEYQDFEQVKRSFVLIGFCLFDRLAEHTAGFLVQCNQQMNRLLMQRQRAAEHLAVDTDCLQ